MVFRIFINFLWPSSGIIPQIDFSLLIFLLHSSIPTLPNICTCIKMTFNFWYFFSVFPLQFSSIKFTYPLNVTHCHTTVPHSFFFLFVAFLPVHFDKKFSNIVTAHKLFYYVSFSIFGIWFSKAGTSYVGQVGLKDTI